ncbi:MAG: phospholipid/cholesterol/gamma-HCH transport system substrate-binding protein [Mycobacterium sp.]|jgi:phospholipid/cholesterol/gamma-HCH transport system substrate-binding protein|nr:phospholipid/cholesterol/gamma-HCH transport system substrate-binding protein [Mycobacterium sp.]
MSTVFNIRNLKRGNFSRAAIVIAVVVVVLAIVAGIVGYQLYKKLANNTVVAYFPEVLALYPGDKVQIMGVQVGNIDTIEPRGDQMKVTFTYDNSYKVPADAIASVLNPSLVASRTIQLSPKDPNTNWDWMKGSGPVMKDGAVIPIERTQVPVEWDELRNSINRILQGLGPQVDDKGNVKIGPDGKPDNGPFPRIIDAASYGLAGRGQQINNTLNSLSEALTALNKGRGDFFGVVRSLALFVNALYRSDQQFVALNDNLASFTQKFNNTNQEVANSLRDLDQLLGTTRQFLDKNAGVLTHDVDNLADTTTAILQPEPRDGLETGLHVFPNLASNLVNITSPIAGGIVGLPVLANFANPMQFICSAIQAGSRLGYQESAELCAQYLGPILDGIKFNYLPFGANTAYTAETLPKQVAYSEDRLRPPPGYKDTTVPGVWSRDTLFSHGNHEPGWVVAPGMQGTEVQPFTQNMLTPESLAELMGGPDIVPPPAPPAFGVPPGGNLPGPPNAYGENSPAPPPWYPQAPPPPAPAPGVVPGPMVAPAPVAGPPPPGGFPAEGGG